MAVARCQHCDILLTEDEAAGPACPACASPFAVKEAAPPPPPPPEPARPWGLIVAVAALSAATLSLWATRPDVVRAEQTPEYAALLEQKESADSALAAAAAREKRAAVAAKGSETREKALAGKVAAEGKKRNEAEAKLAEALTRISALEKVFAEVKERADTVRLDQPGGHHRIDSLKDGQVVKLAGRIGTLHIGSISGGSTLDASRLEAREVHIERTVSDKSRAILRATVNASIHAGIDGGSSVDLEAPTGRVNINALSGGSRARLRGKEVAIHGVVSGPGTAVEAILTANGSLRFNAAADKARLVWRKDKASDPRPRVSPGRVEPGAAFENAE